MCSIALPHVNDHLVEKVLSARVQFGNRLRHLEHCTHVAEGSAMSLCSSSVTTLLTRFNANRRLGRAAT